MVTMKNFKGTRREVRVMLNRANKPQIINKATIKHVLKRWGIQYEIERSRQSESRYFHLPKSSIRFSAHNLGLNPLYWGSEISFAEDMKNAVQILKKNV